MSTDDETKELAEQWLDGASHEELAETYGVDVAVIKRRLKWAKATLPDLPWDQRKSQPAPSPRSPYLKMKDGVPGTRGMPMGKVVKARGGRRYR
jgi:uncharacterized protein YjcR